MREVIVIKKLNLPRFYLVKTFKGKELRRNKMIL